MTALGYFILGLGGLGAALSFVSWALAEYETVPIGLFMVVVAAGLIVAEAIRTQ
jgi:hypothetical protein